jgi:hypothetical protein
VTIVLLIIFLMLLLLIISTVTLFWFIAEFFGFCFLGMICARLAMMMAMGAMVVVGMVVIFF